jgi:hypothetical protein
MPLSCASGEIEYRQEDENFGNRRTERLSHCADPVSSHFLPFQVSTKPCLPDVYLRKANMHMRQAAIAMPVNNEKPSRSCVFASKRP